jgi:glutaminyl-peptide cyclotransferase
VFSPLVAQNACMSLILKARLVLILALSVAALQCNAGANSGSSTSSTPPNAVVAKHSYQIVKAYPHDTGAFTQGLIFVDGKLYEGTGQEGRSSVREVDLQTGRVLKKVDIPEQFFGEGITLLNGKIYQLTWQHQVGFIYNAQTLEKVGEFNYTGQGWGITNDGRSLIISDGSNRLKFLDPDSFRVTKTIAVLDGRTSVDELNELEYVNGEIYANIWHDQRIVTIDPQNGRVTGWIDLTGLLQPGAVHDEEAVLNGIAYDQAGKRLFVTGKLWPQLFEIKLKPQS